MPYIKITLDLTTPIQTHFLYLTLVTLLFSYAYESRTSQHDPTPESAWTICSLTPAFSALDPPNPESPYSPVAVLNPNTFSSQELITTFIPSYRRSLAFLSTVHLHWRKPVVLTSLSFYLEVNGPLFVVCWK